MNILSKRVTRSLGPILLLLGLFMIGETIYNRHSLPQVMGVFHKTQTQIVYKDSNPLILGGDLGVLGPTTVQSRWESTVAANKGSSVGQYQFKDDSGVVQVLKFCNEPSPDFYNGTVLTIEYIAKGKDESIKESLQKEGCVLMTKATIIKEPPPKVKEPMK